MSPAIVIARHWKRIVPALLALLIFSHCDAQRWEDFKDQRLDEFAIRQTADSLLTLIANKDYAGARSLFEPTIFSAADSSKILRIVDQGNALMKARGVPGADAAMVHYSMNVIGGDSILINSIIYPFPPARTEFDGKPKYMVFNFANRFGASHIVGFHIGYDFKP